jgi:predicted extracellular nuclease
MAFFLPIISFSQNDNYKNSADYYRIMFYNVENYFDAVHDTSLAYNEFTPNGDLHWTNNKYIKKRNNIYKVIKAVGGWGKVALIGLVEVENEFVISDLISNTPLAKEGYDYVHYESNDFRGIDVALLYLKSNFKILFSEKVVIRNPQNPNFTTRDMLYVKGILGNDTVHVIVNHWTSRYRGYLESEPLRMLASKRLIRLTDSICKTNTKANILLMGDFNDNPDNKSIQLIKNSDNCNFKNIELISTNPEVNGTLKYKSNWSNFDQFLISNSLLSGSNGIECLKKGHIFDADFLLEKDLKYFGLKTNRTNIGFKYHGGFSDHLPIYIDVIRD